MLKTNHTELDCWLAFDAATGTVVQSVTPPVPDVVTVRLSAAEAELKALRELPDEVRQGGKPPRRRPTLGGSRHPVWC
jgi:hypothetical protein